MNNAPHSGKAHHPRRRRKILPGELPGTLIPAPGSARPVISVIGYNAEGYVERQNVDLAGIAAVRRDWPRVWIDVVGLGDAELIGQLGEALGLHRLALEDVLNLGQRAKFDDYDDHLFIVTHAIHLNAQLSSEQLSLFVGRDYVLSFQEQPEDPFDHVRERLRSGRGRVRAEGIDYLLYCLLDSVIDHIFPVLEHYDWQLETLEESIIRDAAEGALSSIHAVRRDLRLLRRLIWPLQTVLEKLMMEQSELVAIGTHVYLRDCLDHVVRLMDLVDTQRDLAAGLMDYHLSIINNRMNEVMKVLTVVASIFIPLTFVAGLYGMNFDPEVSRYNMPEIEWRYGYPAVLGLMFAIGGGMLWYFRKKRWL